MRILDVTVKDLTQLLRDWKSAAFLVAAPILFTLLMGFMMGGFGSGSGGETDTRPVVGVLNRDSGRLGGIFPALIESGGVLRTEPVSETDSENLDQMVRDGKYAAVVVVPAGYSDTVFTDGSVSMDLVEKPGGAGADTVRAGLDAARTRLAALAETARLAADAYALDKPFASPAERTTFLVEAVDAAAQAWANPPATIHVTSAAGKQSAIVPSGFAQSSPGNMVTFALAGLVGAAEIVVVERKSGTLARLLTTSISRAAVLAGHFLAMCALIFVQVLLLGAIGQFAFGLGYLLEPAAFLVMAAAVTLWIAGMGLLIGVIARSSEQVAMLAIAPMLALAGLGGAWMPLEVTSPAFQAVGRLTPTAWAMQGMQNIILRGEGLAGVLAPAGVLLLFAAAFAGLAVWRFQSE